MASSSNPHSKWNLAAVWLTVGLCACSSGEVGGPDTAGDFNSTGAEAGGSSNAGDAASGTTTADGTTADDSTLAPGVDLNDPERCVSNREFLAREAWSSVFESRCITCHGPGGVAQQQNAEFQLMPPSFPGFLDVNLANISKVAKNENEGVSILLRKPLGELEHGGAAAIQADSEEYATLEQLVARVTAEEECPDSPAIASFEDVQLLDAASSFRKASLNLAGRLPTSNELEQLAEAGDEELPALIDGLMTETAFFDRLKEVFNDLFLTDRYLRDSQNVLNSDDFPASAAYYESLDETQRNDLRRDIAREPLELIAYIVRNELPFTEIVTADYTVMNPQTAQVFNNSEIAFDDLSDASDFQPGQMYIQREEGLIPIPHAGVLTSPMWLNRYPTSQTNRNRHRAYVVLRDFLATDILKVASRPIDPTAAVNFANPTREDPACQTCHVTIDPVAGAFQKWDDNDQERYQPDREWHTEMYLPGFADEQMQVSDYPLAQRWLGEHIAADERFPYAVMGHLFKALIGREPMSFPAGSDVNEYVAWSTEDATLRAIAQNFADAGFNLKVAIRELLLSAYFRAANAPALSEARVTQLDLVGTGQFLTPEAMSRKLEAVLGYAWRDTRGNPVMIADYNLLYGGIDSDAVIERLTSPNGIMAAIGWRVGNRVACMAVPWEFKQAAQDRVLFPNVDVSTVPEDEIAQPIEDNVTAIRGTLQKLYFRVLGESVDLDGPEVDLAYGIFLDTWREGRSGLASDTLTPRIGYTCEVRINPETGEELLEENRLTEDPNYVIRSWMAVMTFFLADYKFLYQ